MSPTIQPITVRLMATSPTCRAVNVEKNTPNENFTLEFSRYPLTTCSTLSQLRIFTMLLTLPEERFSHFSTKISLLQEYGARVTHELSELVETHRRNAVEGLKKVKKILFFVTERATHRADVVSWVVHEETPKGESCYLPHPMSVDVRPGQDKGEFLTSVEPCLDTGILVSA